MHENPSEFQKIRDNESLIPSAVSEIIRYQTPLSYMRRTAKEDVEIGGKQIKKGDKIAMWYASGNRDESFFPDADKFIIDRPNVRRHMAFGFGIHRCMGNRVAEAQLRIVWEEILKRFERLEVVGPESTAVLGLYAAGSTGQGGLLLEGHGHHLAWAFISGRIAGRNAAHEVAMKA